MNDLVGGPVSWPIGVPAAVQGSATHGLPRPPALPGPRDWPLPTPAHPVTETGPGALRDDGPGTGVPWRAPVASASPYVDVTSGAAVLRDDDVVLPGTFPLVLRRTYRSSWRRGGWFGPSWSSTLDERLLVRDDEVLWLREDATEVRLRLPEVGRASVSDGPVHVWLKHAESGSLVLLEPAEAVERHFLGGADRPLAAVVARSGERVVVVRNATGTPLEVRHSGGSRVLVECASGRVVALRTAGAQEPGPRDRWVGAASSPVGQEVRRFGYDDHGRLARVAVPVDEAVELEARLRHDVQGRLVELGGDVSPVLLGYDGEGRVGSVGRDDARCQRLHYDADADDPRLLRSTHSGGTTWSLDRYGRVERVEHDGVTVELTWDDRDRLGSLRGPEGTATWEHDVSGRVVAQSGPHGEPLRWAYRDALGNAPTELRLPDGSGWEQALDPVGRPRETTDPTGATTTVEIDPAGRQVLRRDPLGAVTRTTCDGAGLPVLEVRPGDTLWRWERDQQGRVTSAADAWGERTTATWGVLGLTSLMPPDRGRRTWSWTRGDDGALELVDTDADGRVARARYVGGVLQCLVRHDGTVVAARSPAVVEPAGAGGTVRREHDAWGRVVLVADDDGSVALERDPVGRVCSEQVVTTDRVTTVRSTWDAAGRRTSRTLPSGLSETWTYGRYGVAMQVELHVGEAVRRVDLHHDPCGRLIGVVMRAGCTIDTVWEADGRMSSQTVTRARGEGADEPGLDMMALLEARLSGAAPDPARAAGSRVTLARHWTWSPAGRLLDQRRAHDTPEPRTPGAAHGTLVPAAQDALGRATTGSRAGEEVTLTWDGTRLAEETTGDRCTSWVELGGRPLLRVERVGSDVRLRLAVLGPDGRPFAEVDEDGEVCWSSHDLPAC